ncbi:hypothetical protein Emed_004736 [Eimeria media]
MEDQEEEREIQDTKTDRKKRIIQPETKDVASRQNAVGKETKNVQSGRKKQPERSVALEEPKREKRVKTPKTLNVKPAEGAAEDETKRLARSGREKQHKSDVKNTPPEEANVSRLPAADKQAESRGASDAVAAAATKQEDEERSNYFRREREALSAEGWILTGIECRVLPESACYDRFKNRSPQ